MANTEDRAERFERLRANKPQPGDILVTKDGKPVPVFVDKEPAWKTDKNKRAGGSPNREKVFMFCNAVIDPEASGWWLSDETSGLKCMIMPDSQKKLMQLHSNDEQKLKVTKLRVVRYNGKNTALICELVR